VTAKREFGSLARLAGTWEGDEGLDIAYSNQNGCLAKMPYRERTTFSPFGPVENGSQVLYGLDYRTSAWRPGEEIPFRGPAGPGDSTFTMTAEVGSETYGILSNRFLAANARSTSYAVTVSVDDDGTYSYEETTTMEHRRSPELVVHTDRNRLHRVE
jgi:hypothetical protein